MPQNVHGPKPSFMQMTLPQARQFGAAPCRGCRVATQLHFRLFLSSNVGFVVISSARIADSRSANAVDCPAIGVPPDMETLVDVPAGFGVELRDTGVDLDLFFVG